MDRDAVRNPPLFAVYPSCSDEFFGSETLTLSTFFRALRFLRYFFFITFPFLSGPTSFFFLTVRSTFFNLPWLGRPDNLTMCSTRYNERTDKQRKNGRSSREQAIGENRQSNRTCQNLPIWYVPCVFPTSCLCVSPFNRCSPRSSRMNETRNPTYRETKRKPTKKKNTYWCSPKMAAFGISPGIVQAYPTFLNSRLCQTWRQDIR
jgi:hypothetical protein